MRRKAERAGIDVTEALERAGLSRLRRVAGGFVESLYDGELRGERVLVTVAPRQERALHAVKEALGFVAANVLPLREVLELDDESVLIEAHLGGEPATVALPLVDVARIGVALVEALATIHVSGHLANGLRPELVFLDGARFVGLTPRPPVFVRGARRADVGYVPLFSVDYVAPELLMGQPASRASDVFALAAVLVRLATNAAPFAGASPVSIIAAVIHGKRAGARLPGRIGELLERALASEPSARPTLRELHETLLRGGP